MSLNQNRINESVYFAKKKRKRKKKKTKKKRSAPLASLGTVFPNPFLWFSTLL